MDQETYRVTERICLQNLNEKLMSAREYSLREHRGGYTYIQNRMYINIFLNLKIICITNT